MVHRVFKFVSYLPPDSYTKYISTPSANTNMYLLRVSHAAFFIHLLQQSGSSRFHSGSQDVSGFLAQRASAESGSSSFVLPPWLGGEAASQPAPCVPDDDMELEWIHGYSAQVR